MLQTQGFQPERSQSQNRLKSLADTLNQTQTANKLDSEAAARAMEGRIGQLQQKVEKQYSTDQQKFSLLADQLQKLFAAQAAEKASRDLMNTRKSKEIELVQTSLVQAFENEDKLRDEIRNRTSSLLQDKVITLANDLSRMQDEGTKLNENQFKYMRENVAKVIQQIQLDRQQTDDMYKDINVALDQQCLEIRNMILKESQDSEQQQQTFTETFKKVCQMLQQKLIIEREEREKKEEQILGLLEQVCLKVEEYNM
ncbi:Conserved_hypothetical protein [Hexamita inflata]|uniref:SF-assemblin n=1 Tax=Hexamita inflata TaxID=28002 RepID=A0AA86TRM1_9EUKA|nr:Conserved hypothetical protein [Hexamita inflata]CAI9925946.1 Conserved hypothetical protein [Hexamita inflata]CAI9951410.1 Conserved hypothetical protein [Hexamita inflata]